MTVIKRVYVSEALDQAVRRLAGPGGWSTFCRRALWREVRRHHPAEARVPGRGRGRPVTTIGGMLRRARRELIANGTLTPDGKLWLVEGI